MFQHRHYEFLASFLASYRGMMAPDRYRDLVMTLGNRLAGDNPRFVMSRYLTACGVDHV